MTSLPFGPEASALSPRWYQEAAVDAAWSAMRHESPCIVIPTGGGKSLVIAALCRKVLDFGGRVMVLQPSKELIQQNADECRALMPGADIGYYSAGLGKRHTDNAIVFAGIQSCFDKSHLFGSREVVLIDECFTGDTPISTPKGTKCLADIRQNDVVCNAVGFGKVEAVKVSWKKTITIGLSDGTRLRCTANHPFFTARGWVNAGALQACEYLADFQTVSEMWSDASPKGVSQVSQQSDIQNTGTTNLDADALLLDPLCEAPQQCVHATRGSAEDQRHTEEKRPQALQSWRQRQAATNSGDTAGRDTWSRLATRNGGSDEARTEQRISELLQARHWELGEKNRDRSGRRESCRRQEETGRKEGCVVEFVRLEGDSDNESTGTRPVYNLQVSGHPSYFAGGVLVHNCHLLPPDGEGRFRTFLTGLKSLCPHVRLVGLTATAFRTGSGALCGPENLLTKVCFSASVSRLMTEGYLCKVTTKPMVSELDTSGLRIVARTHEFDAGDSERLFNTDDNVAAAVSEIVEKTRDRHSILLFCSGVKHAEHVADVLATVSGERVGLVTGDTMPIKRSTTLANFKSGALRWLVNVDVLTTGFNSKNIDAICVLRATASPGLFAQICGRGFRVHESKQNCLILDLGENIKRHGPIDADDYGIPPPKAAKDSIGSMPSKTCPACGEPQLIAAKACTECGFAWPEKPRHEANADTESAILQSQVEPTEWIVESVTFHRHEKRNDPHAPNTLRVDYVCQLAEHSGNMTKKTISEWVCVDHEGFAKRNAMKWWRERCRATLEEENDSHIDSAIDLWKRGAVAIANRIWTVPDKKFTKIVRQELDDVPEAWADEHESDTDAVVAFDYEGAEFFKTEVVPF